MTMQERSGVTEEAPLEALAAKVRDAASGVAPPSAAAWRSGEDALAQLHRWIDASTQATRWLGARAPLRAVYDHIAESLVPVELSALTLPEGDRLVSFMQFIRDDAARIGARREPLGRSWPELFPRPAPEAEGASVAPASSPAMSPVRMTLPRFDDPAPAPSGGGCPATAPVVASVKRRADRTPSPAGAPAVASTAPAGEDAVARALLDALATQPLPGAARAEAARLIAGAIEHPSPEVLRQALAVLVSGQVG